MDQKIEYALEIFHSKGKTGQPTFELLDAIILQIDIILEIIKVLSSFKTKLELLIMKNRVKDLFENVADSLPTSKNIVNEIQRELIHLDLNVSTIEFINLSHGQ